MRKIKIKNKMPLIIIALILLNFAALGLVKTSGAALSLNSGVAFGVFSGAKYLAFAASLLSLILVLACIVKFKNKKLRLALSLIAGGVGANFIERVIYGFITDYIYIGFGPNLNLADVEIILGGMAFAFLFYKNYYL